MRAYFDTNVYDMISDRDEVAEVQAFTREIGCVVLASEFEYPVVLPRE